MKSPVLNEKLTTNNFWDFYTKHMDLIDLILNARLTRFGNKYNLDDLRNEVIICLFDNNAFAKYDASKSKLNTFLTNTITDYIRHCVRKDSISGKVVNKYLPTPTLNLDKPMKAKQVFLVSLNDYDSEEIKEELSSEEDLLDNIDRKMRFEKLNKSLNNDIRDCFSWLIQGFSQREIADKLNTCTATVRENYFQKIKRAAIKTGFVTE